MENQHLGERIAKGLRKSAEELEKLDVQLHLGKMEAIEVYESMRKKYAHSLHEIKNDVKHQRDQFVHLLNKLEELRIQLELGKTETIEAFNARKKQLKLAIHELEVAIKTNPEFIRRYSQVLESLELLKLKLEVLNQRTQPARERLHTFYEQRKAAVEQIINGLMNRKETPKRSRWENFQVEMSEAYAHLKKAFVSN
jgi:hypothetical protein